jgi:hypothetical protein
MWTIYRLADELLAYEEEDCSVQFLTMILYLRRLNLTDIYVSSVGSIHLLSVTVIFYDDIRCHMTGHVKCSGLK